MPMFEKCHKVIFDELRVADDEGTREDVHSTLMQWINAWVRVWDVSREEAETLRKMISLNDRIC